MGGYTRTESKLDFAGNSQTVVTKHKRLNTDTEKVTIETFTYDHQNRLLVHKHMVDSNPEEILSQNKYNELSQLESKKVGGVTLGSSLQQIDYKYNIRGWMTQINDPANLGNDLFGYKINYNKVEGQEIPNNDYLDLKVKPKYNGNIAEVSWKTLTENNEPLKTYGYAYDSLNRLTAGFYQKAGNEFAKEYFERLEYDLNGNITNLQRSAGVLPGSNTALVIDNLKYDYVGNKLIRVTDQQMNPSGYPYMANPGTIGYDNDNVAGNGNMISHPDKGISSIQYNYLNLPKQIVQNDKVTNYIYRADGVKVKKVFGDIETDYLDGFQYRSTKPSEGNLPGGGIISEPDTNEVAVMKLRIIPTSEGYYDALLGQYIYNFIDHLGNVRLSYSDTNKDGSIQPRRYFWRECDKPSGPFNIPNCIDGWKPGEIVEVNNYYPFGLLHNYTATTQNAYQYKYNSKELQETGMYDYGARMYMPDIGRFGTIDPLAEKYPDMSPFTYVANNPVKYTDPTGMWIDIKDGDNTYRYNNGKYYTQNAETKKWDVEASVKSDSYAGQILSALTSITGGDENSFGSQYLNLFANDDINTTIKDSSLNGSYKGLNGATLDGSTVFTAFKQDVTLDTTSGSKQSPFHVTLFHELGHSFSNQVFDNNILRSEWTTIPQESGDRKIPKSEVYSSTIENVLRAEQNLPLRLNYSPGTTNTQLIQKVSTVPLINNVIYKLNPATQNIFNSIIQSKKSK
ncbi:hypothetical protein BBI01_20710 [Chryseobacterium artocarpi]|uniref:RHS repeat-associated core domain-containing protein n=1 Tax=Chryseobacterium artocarpi TaxID=1414727 RepID=A0A1B8Z8M6_9FLAO|nr:hypothetical protein BBI01_20710 [Chryseobacterium artocarpi]